MSEGPQGTSSTMLDLLTVESGKIQPSYKVDLAFTRARKLVVELGDKQVRVLMNEVLLVSKSLF